MPYHNIFTELVAPDYSSSEVKKLLDKCRQEFTAQNQESEFYLRTILPLLAATKVYLDHTATEPAFRVFQAARSQSQHDDIKNAITKEIKAKTTFLAEMGDSDPRRDVTASAIQYCSKCIRRRLSETEGVVAHEQLTGKHRS